MLNNDLLLRVVLLLSASIVVLVLVVRAKRSNSRAVLARSERDDGRD